MIGFIFLAVTFFHGYVIVSTFLRKLSIQVKLASGFIFGSIFSVSGIYWITCLTKSLNTSLIIFFLLSFTASGIFFKKYKDSLMETTKIDRKSIFIFLILFLFSFWLFGKSFGYDSTHGNFLIASNVYVDFGAHIPFIRSFSLGNNFPGEVPFFANAQLPYYFLFDFYTGILEHLGIPIDIAYNLLSSFSFSLLFFLLYQLSTLIFSSKKTGIFSVIFFLFSSNLSFLTFFQKYGFRLSTLSQWWHNNFYYEGLFTPLSKTISVSGFWNLNPYMNQRHLIFGIAFLLLFVYIWVFLWKKGGTITNAAIFILGISLGLFPYWHAMIFLMLLIVGCMHLILYKTNRKQLLAVLLIGLVVALPQLLFIRLHSANAIVLKPGFLLENMLTFQNEIIFWGLNLGISIVTIIGGFWISSKDQKKFFLLLAPLFILPNIVHFSSRYPFDDHKYFLVWIMGMNMFSAYYITRLFLKGYLYKILTGIFIIFLTLSGIISFMVIKNDVKTVITDYPHNTFLTWSKTHLPNTQTIFTNGEIYDPITLVGKKTFLGRSQYIYNYGGDLTNRLTEQQILLQGSDEQDIMKTIQRNHLEYFVFYKNDFAKNEKTFNKQHYDAHYTKIYEGVSAIVYKI